MDERQRSHVENDGEVQSWRNEDFQSIEANGWRYESQGSPVRRFVEYAWLDTRTAYLPDVLACHRPKEGDMAKGESKGNRESKKPKKAKVKTIAAAPSQKGATAGWQPTFGSGKKK